jgi:hypothetical protein
MSRLLAPDVRHEQDRVKSIPGKPSHPQILVPLARLPWGKWLAERGVVGGSAEDFQEKDETGGAIPLPFTP